MGVLRSAAMAALLASLCVGGCTGSEEDAGVPKRPTTQQTIRLIRSCEVRSILFTHSGKAHLTLRGGKMVFVAQADTRALAKTANDAYVECDMAVAIE